MRLAGKFLPIFMTALLLLLPIASHSSDEKRRALERKLAAAGEPCVELGLLRELLRSGAIHPLEHAVRTYILRSKAGDNPDTVYSEIRPGIDRYFKEGSITQLKSDSEAYLKFKYGEVELKVLNIAKGSGTLSDILNEHEDLVRSVSKLDLGNCNIKLPDVQRLAAFPDLSNLKELNLNYVRTLGTPEMKTLASAHMSNLTVLHAIKGILDDEGLKYLSQSPNFQKLEELHISENNVSDTGVRALTENLKNLMEIP